MLMSSIFFIVEGEGITQALSPTHLFKGLTPLADTSCSGALPLNLTLLYHRLDYLSSTFFIFFGALP